MIWVFRTFQKSLYYIKSAFECLGLNLVNHQGDLQWKISLQNRKKTLMAGFGFFFVPTIPLCEWESERNGLIHEFLYLWFNPRKKLVKKHPLAWFFNVIKEPCPLVRYSPTAPASLFIFLPKCPIIFCFKFGEKERGISLTFHYMICVKFTNKTNVQNVLMVIL